MNKTFFRHLLIYGLGVAVINAAGFFLIPLYTRFLSASEFGVLDIVNRCIEITNIILTAGLGITSLSFYSSETEQSKKDSVISTAIIALFISSLGGIILFIAIADSLNSYFLGGQEYLLIFRMASGMIIAELLITVPMAYLQACMKSKLYVVISICRFLVIIGLNIMAVVFLNMRLEGIIIANLTGNTIFAVIFTCYTLYKTGIRFDILLFKKMLAFGLPFIPGGIFLFILNNGERFFIQTMLDSATLGVYSLGYKIGTIVLLSVLGPFLKIWAPHMFKLDKDADGSKAFGKFFVYLTALYCVVALPIAIFSKEIIKMLSGENYWDGYKVVPYILIAYLFWSAASFFDSGFYITKKTFYKPFIMGAVTILAIVLYWFLVPMYGLLGGAYATVICFGLFSIITYIVSYRIYPLQYPLGKFAYILGLGIVMYLLGAFIPEKNIFIVLIIKTLIVVSYPIVLLTTGVLDYEDIAAAKDMVMVRFRRNNIANNL